MYFRNALLSLVVISLMAFIPTIVSAHHMAPDDLQDFITDQLEQADSPHLLSSDDDPSLLGVVVEGMDDIDYVIIVEGLTANEVTDVLEDVLEKLAREDDVCDVQYVIQYDTETLSFTLIVYVDYCSQ